MANIRIDINGALMDGHEVSFKAPCDCTAIDGIKVYYIENGTQKNKVFALKDTHGNTLTGIGNLFTKDSVVKVILDIVKNAAYIQNADTNAYLEDRLKNFNKVVSGENIVLKDSKAGGLKINEIPGNTEQRTLSGNQLFDGSLEQGSIDGTGNKVDNTLRIRSSDYISVKANTVYTFSASVVKEILIYEILSDGTLKTSAWQTLPYTITTNDATSYIVFILRTNATSTEVITPDMVTDFMFNEGSTALPFEPYCGGIPSPNPEYQQEINSVKGKNLLDCRGLTEQTIYGVKFTPVYDENGNLQYVNLNGIATDRANYTLKNSFSLSAGRYIYNGVSGGSYSTYGIYIGGVTYVSNGDTNFEVSDGTFNTYISVFAGATLSNVKIYPMIRKATIADDTYVPYGLLRFKASGKNLLDVNSVVGGLFAIDSPELQSSGNWLTTKFIEVIEKVVTVSVNNESDNCVVRFNEYDSEKNFLKQQGNICGVNGNASKTITLQNDTKYVRLSFGFNSRACTAESYVASGNTIQLEYGSVATEYEPYQENSVILSQPIKLNGIGEVKDRIVEKDGVYGIERTFVNDRLKDKTWLTHTSSNDYGAIYQYRINEGRMVGGLFTHGSYQHTSVNNISGLTQMCTISGGSTTAIYVLVPYDVAQDLSTWQEWLNDNDPYILRLLATPTFEPLPEADQIALRSLMSYEDVTHVYCDSEIAPIMEVKYSTSDAGALSIQNSNLIAINKILSDAAQTAANNAQGTANSAQTTAEAAQKKANESLPLTGGSLSGDLSIKGSRALTTADFTVSGNDLIFEFL